MLSWQTSALAFQLPVPSLENPIRRLGRVTRIELARAGALPVVRPALRPVAPLKHQDTMSGHHEAIRRHGTTRTTADNDSVVRISTVGVVARSGHVAGN